MKRLLLLLLVSAVPALAQITEFPAGANPLPADALKARFTGAAYKFKGAARLALVYALLFALGVVVA